MGGMQCKGIIQRGSEPQVESNLRKGVLTDAEKIIAVDIVECILDGDTYDEEHFMAALARCSTEDIYDPKVQDMLAHIMSEVLMYHEENQVEELFMRAFGPSRATDAVRAFAIRRHAHAFEKNKRRLAQLGAEWRSRMQAAAPNGAPGSPKALGKLAAMFAGKKFDRDEALRRKEETDMARIRWEFVARKPLQMLQDLNKACMDGTCEECQRHGWSLTAKEGQLRGRSKRALRVGPQSDVPQAEERAAAVDATQEDVSVSKASRSEIEARLQEELSDPMAYLRDFNALVVSEHAQRVGVTAWMGMMDATIVGCGDCASFQPIQEQERVGSSG